MGVKALIRKVIKLSKEKEVVTITREIDAMQSLKGKVAVIIGGSGGIGLSIAKIFNDSGCKVILCGTNKIRKKPGDFFKFQKCFPNGF